MSRKLFWVFGVIVLVGSLAFSVADASRVPSVVVAASLPAQSGPPSCNINQLPSRVQQEYARLAAIRVTNYPDPGFVGPAADCRVVQDDGTVIAVNFYWPGMIGGVVYIAPMDKLFTQASVNEQTIKQMLNPPNPGAAPALAQ